MATVIGTTVFEKIKTEDSSGFKANSQAKYKTCNAININNKLIIKKRTLGGFTSPCEFSNLCLLGQQFSK